jgi:hypothetical protein
MKEKREPSWCGGANENDRGEEIREASLAENQDEQEPRNIFSALIRLYRFSPALFVLHLSGALIAWFAPDDALTRWSFLRELVAGIGEIFPMLTGAVRKSNFPDVTALYFSLMLLAVPLRFWVAFRIFCFYRDEIFHKYSNLSAGKKVRVVFFSSISMCIGVLNFTHSGSYDWNFMSISRSKFWLGLIGPIFAGGAEIFCISAGLVSIFISVFYILNSKRK